MRVGGDEFLILCTHCPNDQAHALVDRIRQKLSQRSDEHLTLSVSFGVSTVEGGEFSFDQAYEQADQEMYRDKQASRVQRKAWFQPNKPRKPARQGCYPPCRFVYHHFSIPGSTI